MNCRSLGEGRTMLSLDYDFCFLYHCCMYMSMHVKMYMIMYPDVCFYLLDSTMK